MIPFLAFRDLAVGAKFRFLYNPYFNPRTGAHVFTKIHPRWFEDDKGRRFTTGGGTAIAKECVHNAMVTNDTPAFAWKCADCGYIYGKDGA